MSTTYLLLGLTMGLAGSLHCLGMCGPLALALPGRPGVSWAYAGGRALYHMGRVLVYASMGLVFGLMGWGLHLGGYQRTVSVVAGGLMVLLALGAHGGSWGWRPLARLGQMVQARLGSLWPKTGEPSAPVWLAMGALNGLLPCGLVYVALAGALAGGSPAAGAAYMLMFGLGTVPMMLGVTLMAPWLRKRQATRWVVKGAGVVVGLLLVVRGLALGIPYLSPPLAATAKPTGSVPACCVPAQPGAAPSCQ